MIKNTSFMIDFSLFQQSKSIIINLWSGNITTITMHQLSFQNVIVIDIIVIIPIITNLKLLRVLNACAYFAAPAERFGKPLKPKSTDQFVAKPPANDASSNYGDQQVKRDLWIYCQKKHFQFALKAFKLWLLSTFFD